MIEMPFWLFVAVLVAYGVFCVGVGAIGLLAWFGFTWRDEP